MWIQSSDQSPHRTPFSYAASGVNRDNELQIHDVAQLHLLVNGESVVTSLSANDGKWHHICATWENSAGSWKYYKDGVKGAEGTGLQAGHVIKPGGCTTLGQEQDSLGGGFDITQSFVGMLTNVNVWDYVLTAAQIQQMSTESCLSGEGNVYKWSDFIYGREGKPRVIIPSPCKP
ncbi:hypothetical protein ACROYT_G017030 [Oculina patagonica]